MNSVKLDTVKEIEARMKVLRRKLNGEPLRCAANCGFTSEDRDAFRVLHIDGEETILCAEVCAHALYRDHDIRSAPLARVLKEELRELDLQKKRLVSSKTGLVAIVERVQTARAKRDAEEPEEEKKEGLSS